LWSIKKGFHQPGCPDALTVPISLVKNQFEMGSIRSMRREIFEFPSSALLKVLGGYFRALAFSTFLSIDLSKNQIDVAKDSGGKR
jgi:hypothetical protein